MKKIAFVYLLCVMCLPTALGEENNSSLEIKLDVRSLGKKTFYKLILVNSGDKDVTVITKDLDKKSTDDGAGNLNVTFGYGTTKVEFEGIQLVSSFYAFHPVTLKPKEGTILQMTSKAFPTAFKDLEKAKSIVISYEIDGDWAKRHKTWSGKVSTQTFAVQDGKIVVSEKK